MKVKPRQRRRNVLSATHADIASARGRILLLERLGLSRREIARRAGVAPSTITRIASGEIADLTKTTAAAVLRVRLG
jgi:hypothetical protein